MKGKARKVKSERAGAGRPLGPGPYPSNITDARRNQPFLEPIVVTSSATASFAGLSNEDCGVGISTHGFGGGKSAYGLTRNASTSCLNSESTFQYEPISHGPITYNFKSGFVESSAQRPRISNESRAQHFKNPTKELVSGFKKLALRPLKPPRQRANPYAVPQKAAHQDANQANIDLYRSVRENLKRLESLRKKNKIHKSKTIARMPERILEASEREELTDNTCTGGDNTHDNSRGLGTKEHTISQSTMDDEMETVQINIPAEVMSQDSEDILDEPQQQPYNVNVLDAKTCRVKSTEEATDGLYMTAYHKHDYINPKVRYMEKQDLQYQLFQLEHFEENLYILKSMTKFPGILKPALYYAHHTHTFEVRDVYHRQNKMIGGMAQLRNFLFKCSDYKIILNHFNPEGSYQTCDLELTDR